MLLLMWESCFLVRAIMPLLVWESWFLVRLRAIMLDKHSAIRATTKDLSLLFIPFACLLLSLSIMFCFCFVFLSLGGYRDALKFRTDEPITFDRDAFVQSRPSQSMQAFLESMLQLQIFQQVSWWSTPGTLQFLMVFQRWGKWSAIFKVLTVSEELIIQLRTMETLWIGLFLSNRNASDSWLWGWRAR